MPISDFGDLLNGTLRRTPKGKITETLLLSTYAGTRMFFREAKENTDGGTYFEVRVRLRAGSTARFVNPYQSTGSNQIDLMGVYSMPCAYYEEKMLYDEREKLHNKSGEQVVNIIETRRSGAYEAVYNLLEQNLVLAPTSESYAAGGAQELLGLAYWFPFLANGVVDAVGGYNAFTVRFRNGSTSNNVGIPTSLDASDAANSRLRRWAATYSGTVDPNCVRTIRNAMVNTKFETLPDIDQKTLRSGGGSYLFMGHTRANEYEDIVNAGPDDRDGDALPFQTGTLRGVRIIRMASLDGITFSPIYGCNTRHTYGMVWTDHMSETKPVNSPSQLQTWTVGVVGTCQLVCDNPREGGFCIHTTTSA